MGVLLERPGRGLQDQLDRSVPHKRDHAGVTVDLGDDPGAAMRHRPGAVVERSTGRGLDDPVARQPGHPLQREHRLLGGRAEPGVGLAQPVAQRDQPLLQGQHLGPVVPALQPSGRGRIESCTEVLGIPDPVRSPPGHLRRAPPTGRRPASGMRPWWSAPRAWHDRRRGVMSGMSGDGRKREPVRVEGRGVVGERPRHPRHRRSTRRRGSARPIGSAADGVCPDPTAHAGHVDAPARGAASRGDGVTDPDAFDEERGGRHRDGCSRRSASPLSRPSSASTTTPCTATSTASPTSWPRASIRRSRSRADDDRAGRVDTGYDPVGGSR